MSHARNSVAATAPQGPSEAARVLLLGGSGMLDPVRDAELDRWMSAARRNTGAALAALCLFDGEQRLVRNIQPAVARGDGPDHLEGTFEARLRGLAGASGDVSCLVAVHEVVVDGLIVGHVGIADPARESWSVADLRSLAEIAAVVSTHIEARDARVEVARSRELVTAHNRVHDMIVRGVPLREVLTEICQAIALYDPSLVPSVLQRDPDSNTLHGGVGPQFPQAYHDAIEGAPIGPSIGTCGPAAWFARLTVSENLAEDPNWGPIRGLAQMVGVAHCWSMPAKDSAGQVLGTLAFYGRAPRLPQPEHLALLEDWARVVGAAIERSRNLERLTHDARHDALTGLPNRVAVLERLDFAIKQVRRDAAVAVLFLDLDGLKAINDTLGHDVGDEMLRVQARRLAENVRAHDFVGRLGGDEFIIVAEGVQDPGEAGRLAARLLEAVAQPLTGLTSMSVTASIGIAFVDSPDTDADEALRKADEAMYEAKRAGKDRCIFAEIGHTVQVGRRVQLACALRGAENRGELHLDFQPIVELPAQREVAVEALARWTSPEFGTVEPSEFIPIAEDTGSILPIGGWLLREACEAIVRRNAAGPPVDLHVNVSGRQMANPDFATWVRQTLAHAELPAHRLTLEVTGSVLTRADPVLVTNVRDLVNHGVRLALDDVGVGPLSLEWLYDGLLHAIKLDRSLVARLDTERGRALAAGIVATAHAVGCTVIGEAVETADELARLTALHCDHAQGYHIARPGPLTDVSA